MKMSSARKGGTWPRGNTFRLLHLLGRRKGEEEGLINIMQFFLSGRGGSQDFLEDWEDLVVLVV